MGTYPTDTINTKSEAQLDEARALGRPLYALMIEAGALALSLFQSEALRCTERARCFDREMKRLKGYPILPAGSTQRSWSYFDPFKLCNHCRPYWYAEMAAAEMRECAHFEDILAEEAKRKSEGK